MSIKLDDPDIRAAYDRFKRSDSDTDWYALHARRGHRALTRSLRRLLLGYKGSRDRLSLYGSGSRGMDEAIATLVSRGTPLSAGWKLIAFGRRSTMRCNMA